MNLTLQKILACIVIGLILPLLLYRLQVTPWSAPLTYWNVALISFAIAFLVYKFRETGAGRIPLKRHLANFGITFLVLCGVAIVYLLVLSGMCAAM